MSSKGMGTASVKPTLGLMGATVNAMALIAPGAFLWITHQLQAAATAPSSAAPTTAPAASAPETWPPGLILDRLKRTGIGSGMDALGIGVLRPEFRCDWSGKANAFGQGRESQLTAAMDLTYKV